MGEVSASHFNYWGGGGHGSPAPRFQLHCIMYIASTTSIEKLNVLYTHTVVGSVCACDCLCVYWMPFMDVEV